MAKLTAERLRELLEYDPATGEFRWRVSPTNNVKVGATAGTPHIKGYWQIRVDGKVYLSHRLAYLWLHGTLPKGRLRVATKGSAAADDMRPSTSWGARELTAERLRALLHYSPRTGVFRWRVTNGGRAVAESIAGTVNTADHSSGGGYRYIGVDGRHYLAHRLAWLYMTGEWPAAQIDHKNLVRDDNRWRNLREATQSENGANARGYRNGRSGLKGAYFHKRAGRWVSCIQREGTYHYLGLFDTAEEAHAAYCKAAKRLFGEFARGK
jgi:hypothetical protein